MIIIMDTPTEEDSPLQSDSRPQSPFSEAKEDVTQIHSPTEELYGLSLLQKVITESHLRNVSKWIVPIALIQPQDNSSHNQMTDGSCEQTPALDIFSAHRHMVMKCLDRGAADVIITPISAKCITTLEICAYRAHRDASKEHEALMDVRSGRKRSWVGVIEQKPFAYLREAMVSGLMNGICRLDDEEDQITSAHVAVSQERRGIIAATIGHWHFDAHSYTDEELLYAALVMFKHALSMSELEPWRLSTEQLINFIIACRAAYNNFVPYHNFRHVVDVLQATFNFLVHIGALPSYPQRHEAASDGASLTSEKSPIASILTPLDALTLLITAIGHDVGHPGVNNGFLTTLNAPLAQLYNDRSVLESFHCAAYSQILRRYWPSVFEDTKIRALMISSILATDMGLHFEYMKKLSDAQKKLEQENSMDSWTPAQFEEHKVLACALLIKCADISNVARHHDTALKWIDSLSREFSRQYAMENELGIKSSLFAPPKKDLLSLAQSQLGFMSTFATPLFKGVVDIMPAMKYTTEELETNKALFENLVQELKTSSEINLDIKEADQKDWKCVLSQSGESCQNKDESKPSLEVKTTGSSPVDNRVVQIVRSENDRDDGQSRSSSSQDQPTLRPSPSLQPANAYSSSNGATTSFNNVRVHMRGPFDTLDTTDGTCDLKHQPSGGHRCSELTDGSMSCTATGDWTSQANSTTTGKAPVSPSTQGTSIVSRESMERPTSAPGLRSSTIMDQSPLAAIKSTDVKAKANATGAKDPGIVFNSVGRAEGKLLKKKSSRFRMKDLKDFHFFRRSKASGPALVSGNASTN